MPDSFFWDLCQNPNYSNAKLREDCLRVLMANPVLSEEVDATLFLPSLLSHGIFKAIRTLSRESKKVSPERVYALMEDETKNREEMVEEYLSGSQLITALFMLNEPEDEPEWAWKYSYRVLEWRVENDVCY